MRVLCLTVALSLFASEAWAEEKEPTAIVELGAAGEWDFPSGKLGPTAAVEFTPIKDWLEIEAGVSTPFGGGQREWSTDLLFKKPFTLSDKVEFMFGVGPEWTYSRDGTKIAGEIAAVLADAGSRVRLVFGAELRLRLQPTAPTIAWREWRLAHPDSLTPIPLGNAGWLFDNEPRRNDMWSCTSADKGGIRSVNGHVVRWTSLFPKQRRLL